MLLVGAALLAALVVDWVLATRSYPVAAAYGVSLLLAAHYLSPRAVALTTCLAVVLSVVSNNLQHAPAAAWLADNAGLAGLGVLALLLAREREVAQAARQSGEATQRRVELAYEAARGLAEATTLEAAGSALLAGIGRHLAWACGALWRLDETDDRLVCVATWHRPDEPLSTFEEHMRETRIERGTGLPGRVWQSGQPLWIPDVQREADFPRRTAAIEAGLHTAFGFPIRHAGEVLGVMEFFDAKPSQPDDELLKLMDALGAQVGLFLGRRQAEDRVATLLGRERAARSEADAAVRVRDQFLASASHDLRAPLTAIHGYASLARRRIETGDVERAEPALTSIQACVMRLNGTLEELLDLAKLDAGQGLSLRRAPTDLVALVRRVAVEQEMAVRCSVQVHSDAIEVNGCWDAARLERAVANLVGNAVKYSPPDRAEVRVAISRQQGARGEWAVVQVQDQGIGIPAADLPHIFERFRRGTNVSGRLPGTGLGLAGARDVVEQHGGELSVRSEEGHGSSFTIRLPLMAEEASDPELRTSSG
jgi:signal transduction histidine kinase